MKWRAVSLFLSALALLAAHCEALSSQISGNAQLERIAASVPLVQPVALIFAPGLPERMYVLEQSGRIIAIEGGRHWTALDIRNQVRSGGELGLLGAAFSPQFARDRKLFLSYTRPARKPISTLSVVTTNDGGRSFAPASEQRFFSLEQPYSNHNGGQISFGPDQMLYFSLGDGGAGGDPLNHGQNKETLFGAILRLDVRAAPPYRIPPDNPFVGRSGRDEIYAYGLRNAWRFSFDRQSGELWAADVGQNRYEEINRITRGGNFGWNIREGKHCYRRQSCPSAGLIDPVHEYAHDPHCSVTGGYVYRGARLPALSGRYVFADFCSGTMWSMGRDGGASVLLETRLQVSAFGEGPDGELYLLDYRGGIYALVAAAAP